MKCWGWISWSLKFPQGSTACNSGNPSYAVERWCDMRCWLWGHPVELLRFNTFGADGGAAEMTALAYSAYPGTQGQAGIPSTLYTISFPYALSFLCLHSHHSCPLSLLYSTRLVPDSARSLCSRLLVIILSSIQLSCWVWEESLLQILP